MLVKGPQLVVRMAQGRRDSGGIDDPDYKQHVTYETRVVKLCAPNHGAKSK